MRPLSLLLPLAAACLAAAPHLALAQEGDTVSDAEGGADEREREAPPPPPTPKLQESNGPELYYDGRNFLMSVKPGLRLNVYSNSSKKGERA